MPDDVDVSNITSQKPELAISFQPLVLVKGQFLFEEPSLRSQESKLDSIAVSLFTNSETAAATPLRVMRNFQRTLNQ